MWQTIATASLVVSLVRSFPAFFNGLERIKNSPKLTKFLDYTICLVTGEVIYSIAFNGLPKSNKFVFHGWLITATILLAAVLMWNTTKLSKSLLYSIAFFILGYNFIYF